MLNIFTSGCKTEQRIGVEYERLPICTATKTAASYDENIYQMLRTFAKEDNWAYITDDDCNIVGLKKGHDAITLEPGAQFELNLMPEENICDLEARIKSFDNKLKPVLKKHGITLLNYGVSPVSTHKNINIIPKRRYHIMAKYLWGILSDVMMRETAGVQVCVDFKDEADAMQKISLANKMSPFVCAMFANSPIRGGVDTGYKSFRALSWLNTDNDRCGFAQINSFKDYVDKLLQTPMIYVSRDKNPRAINGKVNFKKFMSSGFEGLDAEFDDFLLHANLYFPEVRLRNYIEIRNHDCCSEDLVYSMLALYKGILYNKTALEDAQELLSVFKPADIDEFRYNVPRCAMDFTHKKYEVKEIAKELLLIAEKHLGDEAKYLDPIKSYTMEGICPADVILKNWYGGWNKDINNLISYAQKI